jgi:hypothetical protein
MAQSGGYGSFQLSLKSGNDLLNIAGENADDFGKNIDSLFGDGTAASVLARFNAAQVLDATPIASVTPIAAAAQAPRGFCPQCGEGNLIKKQRKDGSGSFIACDQFPACNYIQKNN